MSTRHPRLCFLIIGLATMVLAGAVDGNATLAGANEPTEELRPYVRTGFADGVDQTSALLIGFVNPRGSVTSARYQIGRTKAYGRWFPPGQPEHFYTGYHPSELEQGVDGLRPATTYHFRLVATNESGSVAYGKDETLRTLPRRHRRR